MIFSTLKLGIQLPQIERPNRVDPREISTIREDPNSLLYNPRIDLITLAAPSDNTDAGSDVVHLILIIDPNTYDLANDDHNLNAVRLNGPTPQATCYLLSGLNPARSYLNGPNLNDSPQPLVLLHGPNPLDTTPPALSTHSPQPSGLTFSSLTLGKIPTSPATSASTTTHPLRSYTHPTMTIPPQRPPALIPDIINILLPNNGLITSSIVALSTASLPTTSRPYYDTIADNIPPSRRTTSNPTKSVLRRPELGDVPHAPKPNNLPPWHSQRHTTSYKDIALCKSPPP
jgi:hypothetical protein